MLAVALTLVHLGVAGWSISDGKHVVLVDPYFSRVADSAHAVSDAAAVALHAPARADLVLVGHDHYDHALDAPQVALRTGASVLGAAGVVAAGRAAGIPEERLVQVAGGEDLQFDGFSVRVVPSLHSRIGGAWGAVQTFAFLVRMGGEDVLVFDTANFIERELAGLHPDAVIAAPGLREKVYDYSCRLMRVLGQPRRVLATHFDDFHAPVGAPPDARSLADVRAFAAEVRRCSPGTRVDVPAPFVPIALGR